MVAAEYPIIPDDDLPRWEAWIENTTGIVLQGRKRVLEQGIYPRLLACGVSSLEEYQGLIDRSLEGFAEKAALIDQLTVKDSKFFRHPESLEGVAGYLVRRSREVEPGRELRIWSVGCALGQEAWSLAMIAAEQLAYTDVSWQVLGTDISLSALGMAEQGMYLDKQVAGVSPQRMARFFNLVDEKWLVCDELRDRVRFGASNLKDIDVCPYSDLDIIYCQNVLIYFRPDMVNHIVDQLSQRLRPGGLLVLGAGEAPDWSSPAVSRWRAESLNAYIVG
jgi:chemotaxis methyl-accepting protein methylase